MKKYFYIITSSIFILFFSLNVNASKKDVLQELLVMSKSDLQKFVLNKKNRVIGNIKTVNKKPRPKKFRSNSKYEFNYDQLNKFDDYDIDRDFVKFLLPNNLLPQNESRVFTQFKKDNSETTAEEENLDDFIESYDLNQDGIVDTILNIKDPITAFIDINQNGIFEIEYVFYNSQRWVYIDLDEDEKLDYLFKDVDNDGNDEEIIKLKLN